jgi:hypothetical protein
MKNQSMFPYRRNGGKKRGKGGPGRRPHEGDAGGNGGRRIPGSAAELLPLLQPATKALAQMLAGNTRSSGQLAHARNMLAQANRVIDERHADRLPPAAREEFFEQLARLKLTIADAEEAGLEPEPQADVQVKPVEVMGADRLREVALRLAAASAEPTQQVYLPPARFEDDHDLAAEAETGEPHSVEVGEADEATGSRLRRSVANPAEPAPLRPQDAGTATGPRRERLRLKPLRQAGGADADR